MPDHEKPILLSMSLCDLVIRDGLTHKLSLINLFNELRAEQFPCQHPRLHVYVCLTNGRGAYRGTLAFLDTDTGKTLAKLEGQIHFASPLHVVEMNFELNSIAFPHPGVYRFELLCDNELLGARNLLATAIPKAEPR